jgi:transcriptional regulator with XRE-family HTH domain
MTPTQLKDWRLDLAFSQFKLARLLGVHRRTISAWEHARQAMPPFLGLALAELKRRYHQRDLPLTANNRCLSAGDSRT